MLTPKPALGVQEILDFVLKLFCSVLHVKRCRSIANAVVGVVHADRLTICEIGRAMARARQKKAKHCIKQIDALLSNHGVDLKVAFSAWVPWLLGDRKQIVVAMDWTEYDKDGHSRIALYLITSHGRATPLLWKTVRTDTLKNNRNEYESNALDLLREVLPEGVKVTILADRGFGDSSLYEYCDKVLRFDYVIRFRECIKVWDAAGKVAKAGDLVPRDGSARRIDGARVTHKKYRVAAVVVVHDTKMKQAWCLATSRADDADAIVALYAKRFTIEETFRDEKDLRFGMGVLETTIGDPERRDRLILVLAVATGLLTTIGAAGEKADIYKDIKANTSPRRQHSLFRQGREYMRGLEAHRYEDLRIEFARMLRAREVDCAQFGII